MYIFNHYKLKQIDFNSMCRVNLSCIVLSIKKSGPQIGSSHFELIKFWVTLGFYFLYPRF